MTTLKKLVWKPHKIEKVHFSGHFALNNWKLLICAEMESGKAEKITLELTVLFNFLSAQELI